MGAENLGKRLKEYIEKETETAITNDTDNIIESGIIDSFTMIKLINFIEQEFKVSVDLEDIEVSQFNSIKGMAEKIQQWQKDEK